MRIFLVGASGFIGSALARALHRCGHEVTGLARDLGCARHMLPELRWVHGDLRKLTWPGDWSALVRGQDIVINASGALQTGLRDDVGRVQEDAIVALVAAAQAENVGHLIQVSAAGARAEAKNQFMASKARADAAVADRGSGYTVLRLGLVIGRNAFGGTELIRATAGLPLVAPDIAGTGPIQCIALDDVVDAVRRIVAAPAEHVGTFDLVEPAPRNLSEIVAAHRSWLGFAPARARVLVPSALLRSVSLIADALGWLGWRSPLRSTAFAVLVKGVEGDAG